MLSNILEKLGLTENARQIYLRLLENGPSSARQLAQGIGLPRTTIYDNLETLKSTGFVIEKDQEYKKIYSVDDPKNLKVLLKSRIEDLIKDEKTVSKLLPDMLKGITNFEPKIKFYAGTEGIKQVLKDLLWCENIETLTMWPISDMVDILGKDYLEELNKRRIKQNISIRGIWPADKTVNFKDHPYLGVGKGHLRQLRLAPSEMTWDMSYWLYEDKVAFISSKAESFGFVINSRDFANLIKAQFEVIWKISKPINPAPKYTDKFLKSL